MVVRCVGVGFSADLVRVKLAALPELAPAAVEAVIGFPPPWLVAAERLSVGVLGELPPPFC